jgi:hypothetical protein
VDYRQIVRLLAFGRIAVGASFLLAPSFAGGQWIGEGASLPTTKLFIRAMGIRDLALGAGTLQALTNGEPARTWVALSATSDAVDATATALAIRSIPLRKSIPALLVAGGSAVVGALAIERLD